MLPDGPRSVPRPSLGDCLARGIAAARANPELVLVSWLQTLATTFLVVFAIVATLLYLGIEAVRKVLEDPSTLEKTLPQIQAAIPSALGKLAIALVLGSLLLGLAMIVYSWFQAGVFGVLTAADRQAPPAVRDPAAYRTFLVAHWLGWAKRYTWRYFGYHNLFALLGLAPITALMVWAAALALASERWGGGAAAGVGCFGILPVVFLFLVFGLWWTVGMADLAHEDSGVWRATRRGLDVVGHRLGTTLGLMLIFAAVNFGVMTVFLTASAIASVAGGGRTLALQGVAGVALTLVEWLALAMINVVFSGSLVALVGGERRAGAAQ